MKRVIQYLMVVCSLSSMSLGAFDFTVSDVYEYGTVGLDGQSLLVLGAGVGEIDARGSSYIEVYDTDRPLELNVGGIWGMHLSDSSSLMYFGGETGDILLSDHASAILKGGRIDYIISFQYVLHPNANQEIVQHIEVVCDLDSVFHDAQTNVLTGNWKDGSAFNIQLVDVDGYDPVIENMFFTPEPGTLLLLGLGGLLISRKRQKEI